MQKNMYVVSRVAKDSRQNVKNAEIVMLIHMRTVISVEHRISTYKLIDN
jgi:hypothetical protein